MVLESGRAPLGITRHRVPLSRPDAQCSRSKRSEGSALDTGSFKRLHLRARGGRHELSRVWNDGVLSSSSSMSSSVRSLASSYSRSHSLYAFKDREQAIGSTLGRIEECEAAAADGRCWPRHSQQDQTRLHRSATDSHLCGSGAHKYPLLGLSSYSTLAAPVAHLRTCACCACLLVASQRLSAMGLLCEISSTRQRTASARSSQNSSTRRLCVCPHKLLVARCLLECSSQRRSTTTHASRSTSHLIGITPK